MTAADVLNREFLEMRARLIQLAASLDRIDRAEGSVDGDVRLDLLARAIDVLGESQPERAERIQLLFSRPYEAHWRKTMGVRGA